MDRFGMKWFLLIFLHVAFLGDVLSTLYAMSAIGMEHELNPFVASNKVFFVAGNLFWAACLSILLLLAYPSPATASRISNMSYSEILKKLCSWMPIKEWFHEEGSKYSLIYSIISTIFAVSILKFFVAISNVFVIFTNFGAPDLIEAFLGIFSIELNRNSLFFLSFLVYFPVSLFASSFLLKKKWA